MRKAALKIPLGNFDYIPATPFAKTSIIIWAILNYLLYYLFCIVIYFIFNKLIDCLSSRLYIII